MYFKFKATTNPNRTWARKTPNYISSKFSSAFIDNDFIERDHLDDEIISLLWIPSNWKDIPEYFHSTISYVTNALEVRAIWVKTMPVGYSEPMKTIKLIGYSRDIFIVNRILKYIINGFNNLRFELVIDYRQKKINQRRRAQNNKHSIINRQIDARSKALVYTKSKIKELNNNLKQVKPVYSVLHNSKIEAIDKFIISQFKLNYKKYNTKRLKVIKDAFCTKRVINRIIT